MVCYKQPISLCSEEAEKSRGMLGRGRGPGLLSALSHWLCAWKNIEIGEEHKPFEPMALVTLGGNSSL